MSNIALHKFDVDHTPISKPRMTKSDKWKKRACVLEYRSYADAIRKSMQDTGYEVSNVPCNALEIEFYLPIPHSTSGSKRLKMQGSFHTVRPDIDNLIKGVMDAIFEKDSCIFSVKASKYYVPQGEQPYTRITLLYVVETTSVEPTSNVDA